MKVKELIKELENCHPDSLVVIDDADTNWYLRLIGIDRSTYPTEYVILASNYSEVEKDK